MKQKSMIVEPNGQNHVCPSCFRDMFYLTRGQKKNFLNAQKSVWKATAYYIKTCCTCGNVEKDNIYSDRLTYTNEKDFNALKLV